jgi:hypothetical protein
MEENVCEEVRNLWSSPDILRWSHQGASDGRTHGTHMRDIISSYKVLKSEGKKSLQRLRHKGKDNIKSDFKEIKWNNVAAYRIYISVTPQCSFRKLTVIKLVDKFPTLYETENSLYRVRKST